MERPQRDEYHYCSTVKNRLFSAPPRDNRARLLIRGGLQGKHYLPLELIILNLTKSILYFYMFTVQACDCNDRTSKVF